MLKHGSFIQFLYVLMECDKLWACQWNHKRPTITKIHHTNSKIDICMQVLVTRGRGLSARDHVRPALKELHWLPVTYRIQYKMVHVNWCPQYLRDCCLCRQWTRTTRYPFGHQPELHSSKNKNQICRESLFCFWARCLEQSAFVRQIVAGFKRNLKSYF